MEAIVHSEAVEQDNGAYNQEYEQLNIVLRLHEGREEEHPSNLIELQDDQGVGVVSVGVGLLAYQRLKVESDEDEVNRQVHQE